MNPGLIGTVFLRSDAVATIFFSLFILVRLLFKGGVYFVGKPMDSNDSWNKHMHALQLGLIDAGSI